MSVTWEDGIDGDHTAAAQAPRAIASVVHRARSRVYNAPTKTESSASISTMEAFQ
jgi:hypothetical protein